MPKNLIENWTFLESNDFSNYSSSCTTIDGGVLITGLFNGDLIFNGNDSCDNSTDQISTTTGGLFVTRYNDSGRTVWSTKIADLVGQETEVELIPNMIIESGNKFIYVALYADFALDLPDNSSINQTNGSLVIFQLDTDGNCTLTKQIENSEQDNPFDIAVDGEDNLYLITTFSHNLVFDGCDSITNLGSTYIISKLSNSGEWLWFRSGQGTGNIIGNNIVSNNSGNITIAGSYENEIFFNNDDFEENGFDSITETEEENGFSLTNSGSKQRTFLATIDAGGLYLEAIDFKNVSESLCNSMSPQVLNCDNDNNLYLIVDYTGKYILGEGTTPEFNITDGDYQSLALIKLDNNLTVLDFSIILVEIPVIGVVSPRMGTSGDGCSLLVAFFNGRVFFYDNSSKLKDGIDLPDTERNPADENIAAESPENMFIIAISSDLSFGRKMSTSVFLNNINKPVSSGTSSFLTGTTSGSDNRIILTNFLFQN